MSEHDLGGADYNYWYEPATAIQAEGARVGIATCKVCWAAVIFDPRDAVNHLKEHAKWHEDHGDLPL